MNRNIPKTTSTWVRIASVPVFVLLYYLPWRWGHFCAAAFFSLAAITDWLDGYIAKLAVVLALWGFFGSGGNETDADSASPGLGGRRIPVLVFDNSSGDYCRPEIIVSALREWMEEIGKRNNVSVGLVGKIKTTCQMIALIALLLYRAYSPYALALFGTIMLYIAGSLDNPTQ